MRRVKAQIIVEVPPSINGIPIEYAIPTTIYLLENRIRQELATANRFVDPIIVLKLPPQVTPRTASRIAIGLALRFPELGVTTVEQRELPTFARISLNA